MQQTVRVILNAGSRLRVELADENGDPIDGGFEIDHAASESNRLTVTADLSGNVKGEEGVIYEEEWDNSPSSDDKPVRMPEPKPYHGSFGGGPDKD